MRRIWQWFARYWRLKLAALGISLLLWSIVKAEEVVTVDVRNVPVRVELRDPEWVLAAPPQPRRVSVQVTGPVREIVRLAVNRPRIVVPVDGLRDSIAVVVLRSAWVRLPSTLVGATVGDIQPATVRLVFARATPSRPPGGPHPEGGGQPAGRAPVETGSADTPIVLGTPVGTADEGSAVADSSVAPAEVDGAGVLGRPLAPAGVKGGSAATRGDSAAATARDTLGRGR